MLVIGTIIFLIALASYTFGYMHGKHKGWKEALWIKQIEIKSLKLYADAWESIAEINETLLKTAKDNLKKYEV